MKVSLEALANAPHRGHMEREQSSLSRHLCQEMCFSKNMCIIYLGNYNPRLQDIVNVRDMKWRGIENM